MSVATMERPTPTIRKGTFVPKRKTKYTLKHPAVPDTPILDATVLDFWQEGKNPWPSMAEWKTTKKVAAEQKFAEQMEANRSSVDEFSAWMDEIWPERMIERTLRENFPDTPQYDAGMPDDATMEVGMNEFYAQEDEEEPRTRRSLVDAAKNLYRKARALDERVNRRLAKEVDAVLEMLTGMPIK